MHTIWYGLKQNITESKTGIQTGQLISEGNLYIQRDYLNALGSTFSLKQPFLATGDSHSK